MSSLVQSVIASCTADARRTMHRLAQMYPLRQTLAEAEIILARVDHLARCEARGVVRVMTTGDELMIARHLRILPSAN